MLNRRGFIGLLAGLPFLKHLPALAPAIKPASPAAVAGPILLMESGLFQYVRTTQDLRNGELVEWVGGKAPYGVRRANNNAVVGIMCADVSRWQYGVMQMAMPLRLDHHVGGSYKEQFGSE